MRNKEKLDLAMTIESAVNKVRIARREVSELNGKSDPEKELICYSAILKAEYYLGKINEFIEREQKRETEKMLAHG